MWRGSPNSRPLHGSLPHAGDRVASWIKKCTVLEAESGLPRDEGSPPSASTSKHRASSSRMPCTCPGARPLSVPSGKKNPHHRCATTRCREHRSDRKRRKRMAQGWCYPPGPATSIRPGPLPTVNPTIATSPVGLLVDRSRLDVDEVARPRFRDDGAIRAGLDPDVSGYQVRDDMMLGVVMPSLGATRRFEPPGRGCEQVRLDRGSIRWDRLRRDMHDTHRSTPPSDATEGRVARRSCSGPASRAAPVSG